MRAPMHMISRGNGHYYFGNSKTQTGQNDLEWISFPYWAFENAFRWTWCESLAFEKLLPTGNKQSQTEKAQTERALRANNTKAARMQTTLQDAGEDDDFDFFHAELKRLSGERKRLTAQLATMRAEAGGNPQERGKQCEHGLSVWQR